MGTVTLGANASSGATVYWYANATDLTEIATGNSFTTPVISSTKNYFASAHQGASTNTVGLPSLNPSYGPIALSSSVLCFNCPCDYPMFFTANKPGTIKSVTVYPKTIGSFTIDFRLRGSTSNIYQAGPYNVTAADTGFNKPMVLNVNIPVSTPGNNYQLVMTNTNPANTFDRYRISSYNNSGGSFPFKTADTSMVLQGSITQSCITGTASTNLYETFFNVKYETYCETPRVAVIATVTPPPTFTLNTVQDTACGTSPSMIMATNTLSNYSKYTWQPTTGLFTDLAATIPYNAGDNAPVIYARPTSNTSYTCTATDTIGGCVDTNKVNIVPIQIGRAHV